MKRLTSVHAVAAVLAVAALLILVAPQVNAVSSGPLYLQTDGTLTTGAGTTPSACVSLSSTGPSTATATFSIILATNATRFENQSLPLSLHLGANANAGTGILVEAHLTATSKTLDDAVSLGPGTSIPNPLRLGFDLAADNANPARLELVVSLTKTGTGPAALGQSLSIQCGDTDTYLGSVETTPASLGPGQEPDAGQSHGGGLSTPAVLGVALLAGLVTLAAGAMAVSGRTISARRIHLLLGATAGLLLAIAILDLIPEAVELNAEAPYTIIAGLLVLFLVRHFAGDHGHDHGGGQSHAEHAHEHAHHDEDHDHGAHAHDGDADHHGHDHDEGPARGETREQHHVHAVATHAAGLAVITFFALGFHRFVDGLVLPAAFELNNTVGVAAASAVLLHQFPDGIAAASLFLAVGWARRKVLLGIAIMAVLTPLGAIAGLGLAGQEGLVGHLIALAAATFIFIPLAELLPELRAKEHRMPVGVGFALGYAVALLIVLVPKLIGISV